MEDIPLGSLPLEDDRRERLAQEYLKCLNIAKSGELAGYADKSTSWRAWSHPEVQERINFLKAERAKELHIEQVDVLSRLWSVATADPRELVKHKVVNCRFCWGVDHQYQWRDEEEFETAMQQAIAEEKAIQQDMPEYQATYPTDDGGYGFKRTKPPHPECIKCDGEGKGYIHIEDTSTLSESARLLYAGAKQTKEGVEIKMHDQMTALKLVGQHIGMFKDKIEHDISDPLKDLLQRASGNTLKPKG
ncbi:terminase small subunit [Acinetobacter sp. WCHAc060025]|uniref:terminase small subunit n=1 Tax=Acinetobacter sp. WCHAc060025 TaxID=2518625 RepID=UPI0010239F2D|nr:terminase small subunit [Acinetobacter sp. WCHAc060025]RZG74744.1 terminase small subunit [Acinetobacter sp. WCHAc060025]